MKNIKKIMVLILSVLMSNIMIPINIKAESKELENRNTVYYPSDISDKSLSETFMMPEGKTQDSSISGNILTITKSIHASGYSVSNKKLNLAVNDYVWLFKYNAPKDEDIAENKNGGIAFSLHNDTNYSPEKSIIGNLGIYSGLTKSINVEFDNYKDDKFDTDINDSDINSHIAITTSNEVNKHSSIKKLLNPLWNNKDNVIKITWKLKDQGTTDKLNDNTYTLTYEYYQGSSLLKGSPITNSRDFSYNELFNVLGSEEAYVSISGSTGNIAKQQTLSYVNIYPYTINYLLQLKDGTKTTTPVPNSNIKTGKLPEGENSIGTLPTFDKYKLIENQSNVITINTSENIFTFYYEDDAPIINGVKDETIEFGKDIDLNANITAIDDEDGDITKNITIEGNVDSKVSKDYEITYKIKDSAGNISTVKKIVTVNKGLNDTNEPSVEDEKIMQGKEINLIDNVTNINTLPKDTKLSDTTSPKIDTNLPGNYFGEITVTYPDGSIDKKQINIIVEKVIPSDTELYSVTADIINKKENELLNEQDVKKAVKTTAPLEKIFSIKVNGTLPKTGLNNKVSVTITYKDNTKDDVEVVINFNKVVTSTPKPAPSTKPNVIPKPTVTPKITPTPKPKGRTCQDDGYPAGYYWSDEKKACITDIKVTPKPVAVAPVKPTTPKASSTPTPTSTPKPTPTPEISPEQRCQADGKYWYDGKCNDTKMVIEESTIKPEPPKKTGEWSIVGLLITLLSVVASSVLWFLKEEDIDEDGKSIVRKPIYKKFIFIPTVLGIIYFIFSSKFSGSMVVINSSSIISIIIAIVTIILLILGLLWYEKE